KCGSLPQHQVGGVGEHVGPQNGMASSGKSSPADCCGAWRCVGLCALPPPSPRPPTSVTSRTFTVTYVLPSCSRVPISPVTPSCEPFVMYWARRSPRSPHSEQSSQTVCLLSPQPWSTASDHPVTAFPACVWRVTASRPTR